MRYWIIDRGSLIRILCILTVREVFPITPILPRSEIRYGVSDGILSITASGIANVVSSNSGRGAGKSLSFSLWLTGSQYFCDAKTLLPIELLGNVHFGNCGNPEEVGNWQGFVGHLGTYNIDCISWWCCQRRIGVRIMATYHKIHYSLPCINQGLTC